MVGRPSVCLNLLHQLKRVYPSRRNQCRRRCCNLAAQSTTTSTFALLISYALICSEVDEVIFRSIVLLYLKK